MSPSFTTAFKYIPAASTIIRRITTSATTSPPAHHTKFDTLSIFKSFREEVLLLTPRPKSITIPPQDLKNRATSTQNAVPPAIWFGKDVNLYIGRAEQICQAHETSLSRSFLPSPYLPCSMNTEADVIHASLLWLLHPVLKALQAEFTNVQYATEVNLSGCRCDALISVDGKPVVVIEYKNRGYLDMKQFFQGHVSDYSTPSHQDKIQTKIHQARTTTRHRSAMGSNATNFTKQAAAYAAKWQTRYVVLFDWDSLFLWHFAGMNLDRFAVGDGHADWAWGTLVRDRADYRSALLGFILEAYMDKMKLGNDSGKPAPYEVS